MFEARPTRQRSLKAISISLGAHALVAGALLVGLRNHPVHVFTLPGSNAGTRVEIAYLPGRAPAPVTQPQKVKPRATRVRQVVPAAVAAPSLPAAASLHALPTPHLTVTEAAPAATSQTVASPTPDATTGSDSWGDGAMQIALTTFSPSPKPDLSTLPHGVQGDVVIDVTIDPNGKVANLAVLHTLGYGIESSVVGTLKTWVFRPAMKDGTPIASVQELHFHFGPV